MLFNSDSSLDFGYVVSFQIYLISIYNNYIMIGTTVQKPISFFKQQVPYVVRFEQAQQTYGQKGWFFCVDKTLNCSKKKRSEDTRYPFLHKLNLNITQYNNQWRFEPQHDGDNIYKIIVGGGQFEGHELCCFQDHQNDIRDINSFFTFVAPCNKSDKYNKWQVEKIGDNLYIIQNFDNQYTLSAHRYYMDNQSQLNQSDDDMQDESGDPSSQPSEDIQNDLQNGQKKDARNIDSTWIMAHKEKRVVFWKIVPF